MTEIFGWFNEAQQHCYDEAIKLGKDGDLFLEIGALEGMSTCYLAKLIRESGKKIQLYVVDPWKKETCSHSPHDHARYRDSEDFYARFRAHTQEYSEIITPIRATSREAFHQLKDKQFKFIFVDGSHDYSEVKFDATHYSQLLAPGGRIAGDDYWGGGGVRQAVDEVFGARVKFTSHNYPSWYLDYPALEMNSCPSTS